MMRCKRIVKTAVRIAGMGMVAAFMLLGNFTGTMRVVHGEEYEYDALNRVVKVVYEDGSYVEYSYDSNGNIVKVTVHTDKPENPEQPGTPEQPENPDKPDKPEEPGAPTDTEEPEEPEEPKFPVKPWRPVRDDRDDEGDEPEETTETDKQTEQDISAESFDFTNPFAITGNAGIVGRDRKAAVPQTDAKADQSTEREQDGTFTPLIPEEPSQNEAALQSITADNANASEEGAIVLFQILVILFQIFFVPVLKWLTQTL